MSLKFSISDLTIHRIIEQETTFLPALELLPGLTPEVLASSFGNALRQPQSATS